ncbi:nuclear transport factor 2 family protein [Novosphingobium sp. AAP93]|uniref:nuclear transport factor 2 family protein n=1 Tax=Novosphingobium sp. AAP93 TaxID=1523427 RepID=UPI000A435725|nr:nuclear transport factor 2 family protein [Novosphingobium sp. AAP93]
MSLTDERALLNLLGHYTRAHDHRDPDAMAALFTPDATIEIIDAVGGAARLLGRLEGRAAIGEAVRQMMAPHEARAWSQNVISAPIIAIDGDHATIDAQFMVFSIVGAEVPDNGWPAGTFGAQGRIIPIEAGQYRPTMRRTAEGWAISAMRIEHRLPMAFG